MLQTHQKLNTSASKHHKNTAGFVTSSESASGVDNVQRTFEKCNYPAADESEVDNHVLDVIDFMIRDQCRYSSKL